MKTNSWNWPKEMPKRTAKKLKIYFTNKLYTETTPRPVRPKPTDKMLKPQVKTLVNFISIGFIYGIIINYVLATLWEFPFGLSYIFAFGWLFWGIKYELKGIIDHWRS